MAELDTGTGLYRRISAGHPAELCCATAGVLPALPSADRPAARAGQHGGPRSPQVTEQQLEPGDAVLLYTDGITEARDADGELFGLDQLGAFMVDALSRRMPQAETMRRLIHKIVSYENGELRDDATAALLQWRP